MRVGRRDSNDPDARARGIGPKRVNRAKRLARSEFGQVLGDLYHHANVSGPTGFSELPLADQAFWNHWLVERLNRDDGNDDIESALSELNRVGNGTALTR